MALRPLAGGVGHLMRGYLNRARSAFRTLWSDNLVGVLGTIAIVAATVWAVPAPASPRHTEGRHVGGLTGDAARPGPLRQRVDDHEASARLDDLCADLVPNYREPLHLVRGPEAEEVNVVAISEARTVNDGSETTRKLMREPTLLQKIVGHRSLAMISQVYSHMTEADG